MKRYMLFAGDSYYAEGGAGDFKDDFFELENAIRAGKLALENRCDWWHVFDTENRKIVALKNGSYCGQFDDAHKLLDIEK
jgi:hypothetical protein